MSLLELEDYFLSRLHVDFNFPQAAEVRVEKLELSFDYEVLEHSEDPLRCLLKLRVKGREVDEEGSPIAHEIDCEINGQFRISEEAESSKREGMLRVNGVSILYSTLRGIIGNLSGSFPIGRLCFPTIDPYEVVKSIEERKGHAKKPKKSAQSTKKVGKQPRPRSKGNTRAGGNQTAK